MVAVTPSSTPVSVTVSQRSGSDPITLADAALLNVLDADLIARLEAAGIVALTTEQYDTILARLFALDGGDPGTGGGNTGGGDTSGGGGDTSGGTDPILALLPAGFALRWSDDFDVFNVNLDRTLTDAGIQADPGVWGFANLDYQNAGKLGLYGFGLDYMVNPLSPVYPRSSQRTDPLGQVDFSVAGEITFRARPSTSDELAVILAEYANIRGSTTPWVSPLISSRFKVAPKPPFARLTKYKLPPGDKGQWGAADWSLLQGANRDGHIEFEIDSVENFPGQSGDYQTLHRHSDNGGGFGVGNFTPAFDPTTTWQYKLTICAANGTITFVALDESFNVLSTSSTTLTDPTDLASYLNGGHFQIMDLAAGTSWGIAATGTGVEYHQSVGCVKWYLPASNLTLSPPVAPPTDTALTFRSGFAGGVIPDSTDPTSAPVIIGDFSGSATSYGMVGGDGKFDVSGAHLRLIAPVSHSAVSSYAIHYGGRVAGSGLGLKPRITLTITNGGGVPWQDSAAKVSLNPPLGEAYALGVLGTYATYLSGTTASNTFKPMLIGRATSGTIVFKGHGGDANPYGLLGSDLHDGDLRFACEWVGSSSGAVVSFKVGNLDYTLTIPGMTRPSDPWAVVLSWGSDGISIWANGSNAVTVSAAWPTDGTNADQVGVGTNGFLDPAQTFPHLDRVFVYDQSAVGGTNGSKLGNAAGKALAVHL